MRLFAGFFHWFYPMHYSFRAVSLSYQKAPLAVRERSREMQLAPTIQKLKSALEQLRQQEISCLPPLSPAEASRVDEITKALTQKFFKLAVLQLKAACQRGEADQLATALMEVFALGPGIPTGPPAQPAHWLSLN